MKGKELKYHINVSRRSFVAKLSKLASVASALFLWPPVISLRKTGLKDILMKEGFELSLTLDKSNLEKNSDKPIGFWDQGFVLGIVRTDYNFQTKGTENNPLTLKPCLFKEGDPLIIPAGPSWDRKSCALSPSAFSQSNAYTNSSIWPTRDFWVLSVNNEPAYQKKFNSGPPDQSLPITKPGKGIIGVTIIKEQLKNATSSKVILALDHTFAPPGAEGYIPFLGIGADSNRGNGKPISLLNPSQKNVPQKVSFTAKIIKEKNIGSKGTAGVFWFIASAKWGGKNRMVFIALHHNGIENEASGRNFIHGHWNWNIQESFYFPGGDLVYMDAEDITIIGTEIPRITSVGQECTYTIDLQKLFEIASKNANGVTFDTPIPQSADIPVTGVHWAVEMTGKDTELWFSVHGMKMLRKKKLL